MNRETKLSKIIAKRMMLIVFIIINIFLFSFSYDGATFKEGADASQYYIPALSLIEYGGFFTQDGSVIFTKGTPLYSIFLAAPLHVFGFDNAAIYIVFVQSMLLYSTGLISRHILMFFTNKYGFLLHALVIFNPNSLITAHLVQSETLFTFFFALSVLFAFKLISCFSIKNAIFLGIFTGLAILTRPIALYLLMLWPVFIAFSLIVKNKFSANDRFRLFNRERLIKLLVIIIVGGLVISPWYIRNYINTGEIFLTSNAGSYLSDQYIQLKNKGTGMPVANAHRAYEKIFIAYVGEKNNSAEFCLKNEENPACSDMHVKASIIAITNQNIADHAKALIDSWATLFFSGGASNIRNYLGFDGKSVIVSYQNNAFNGLNSVFNLLKSMNLEYLIIFIITTSFSVFARMAGLVGVFYMLKNKDYRPYGMLLIEVLILFVGAYLYLGQSRFRVPLEPFLMLFTVVGIIYIVKKYKGN